MNEPKSSKPFALTERYVSAGTDPDTMLPMLLIEDLSELGFDNIPDQRHVLSPEAATKIGVALLLAADPDLARRLVTERLGASPPPPATTFGSLSEVASFRAGMLAKGSTEEGADWILGVGAKVKPQGRCIDPTLPPESEGQ